MRRFVAIAIAGLALSGCFDSLVGGECAEGWVLEGGECRLAGAVSGDVDAGIGATGDVDGGAATCAAGEAWCGVCVDLSDDPDHCGACGRSCPSGICSAGACVGDVPGHMILIGHDYRVHRAAAARLLGNAASLSGSVDVRVASIDDAATVEVVTAVRRALSTGLAANGRTWVSVDSASVGGVGEPPDVVLVLPRATSADDSLVRGRSWAVSLDHFVDTGGAVIALDGPGGTTTDFLRGAGLLDVSTSGVVTGSEVAIIAPTDALAAGVPSPYSAELGSITFTAAPGAAVVATSRGAALALHLTR